MEQTKETIDYIKRVANCVEPKMADKDTWAIMLDAN